MFSKAGLVNGDFYVSLEPFGKETESEKFDSPAPFLVLSYNAFGEINLEDEIEGLSNTLSGVAELSQKQSSTIFCGITTRVMGLKHISVAVCHKGKLIDIVDRTSNPLSDDFLPSEKIKIFATGKTSIAVLVDTDTIISGNWQKIAPHCDMVLGIIKGSDKRIIAAAEKLAGEYGTEFLLVDDENIIWKT